MVELQTITQEKVSFGDMVEGEYSIEDLGLPMTAVTVVNIRCSGNE
jgi:hypothetical protein